MPNIYDGNFCESYPEVLSRPKELSRSVGTGYLSLLVAIPGEQKKITYIFIFTLLCGASKGFMNALKAFIKYFEAPQRSAKINI